MAFFVPFPLLLAEVVLFITLALRFKFLPVLALYFVPTFFGILLLTFQSRHAMNSLVRDLQRGGRPDVKLLSAAAKFLAALMFLPPMASPRIVGLLLLLPGTRHLMILWAQGWLARKAASGSARMWTSGNFRGFQFEDGPEIREERDADVIEVKALPPREDG